MARTRQRTLLIVVRVALGALWLLTASGCGRSHGPGDGTDGGLTREEFFERFYARRCDEATWCADRVTGATCPHPQNRSFQLAMERAGDNVIYDAVAAAECLESLPRRGECGTVYSPYPPCGRVFLPNREIGQSCMLPGGDLPGYWYECVEGSICVADDACPATCRAVGGGGASCTTHLECESRSCRDGVCDGVVGLGEPCGGARCAAELTCHDGACVELPQRGDECWPDGPLCPLTDLCLPAEDGVRRCDASTSVELGGECRGGRWPDSCPSGMACDAGADGLGVCVLARPLGASCVDVACQPGGRCVDGTCIAVAFPGERCESPPDGPVCGPNHACAGGRCVMRPSLGEPCNGELQCLRGACADGRCTALPEGGDCSAAPALSCVGGCIDGICTGPLDRLGEPCGVPNHCGPELWCRPSYAGDFCAEPCAR